MCQFCRFFAFFASFLPFLFLGVSDLFFGLFQGGATFDLWAGLVVFAVAPCLRRGNFWGSPFANKNQVRGFVVCTSYTVQKPQGGGLSVGAGLCLVCDLGGGLSLPVSLSHDWGGFGCVLECSGDIRTNVRNKCSSGFLCDSQNLSNRILTEYWNLDRILEFFQPNRTECRTESVCQSNRV